MKRAAAIVSVIWLTWVIAGYAAQPTVTVNQIGNRTYYHLQFSLTPQSIQLNVPISERYHRHAGSNEYYFADGGQFEVFVDKNAFPIPAPHCEKQYLILRMPWTAPDLPHAKEYIAEKRVLFDRIKKMKDSCNGSVEVTIELNPFVNVVRKDPLKLEMAGRNIFFRQANGRYVDHVDDKDKSFTK